jgi:2-octaprenyl-6-methoxyphenol hydroxylase
MTIRDIKILTKIISDKIELGLPLDSLINDEFEKNVKHRNFIFSNGIDFVNKFFNIERRIKNNILSRSVQFFGNNRSIKKVFTEIADKGILF